MGGATFLQAQRITASLGGTVRDPNQLNVPGADIQVTSPATGQSFTTQSNADGLFQFSNLSPGSYTVTISAAGFRTLVQTGIILQVDQSATIDFSLTLGATSETIQVTGTAPLLETQSAEVGQVISNKSIVDLPLNQRNPYSLILLVPGVSGSVGQSGNGLQFNVNGGRAGTTDVLLDGIPSVPPTDGFNNLAIFPSVDATQEFKVMTSNYSSQFGLSGGGIINVVYKSGTNQLHGSVYEFLRNSKMDANTYFNNQSNVAKPHTTRSQFGFSLGGPVFIPKLFDGRNKLFFFADYEGLRQQQATTLLATVPTLAERNGDFSADTTSTGVPIIVYDPFTTSSASPYTRSQISCNGVLNVICPARFDAVAKNLIGYFPNPNRPGINGTQINNYAASGSVPYNINQWDVKLDGNMSDRQHLAFRYSVRNPTNGTAVLFPAAIAIAQNASSNTQDAIAGELDYTFAQSAKSLYEIRYGVTHLYSRVTTRADGFDPTQLGFPSYLAQSALATSPNTLTFPGIEMTGYLSLGDGNSLGKGNLGLLTQSWQIDNVRALARHTITYGGEVRSFANNTGQVGRATGDFNFNAVVTQGPHAQTASPAAGDAFASLLLGLGSGGTVTHYFKIINTISQYAGAFVQDDWRATDNLTLNLGLRYEILFPRTERKNRQTYFDPTIPSPLAGIPGLLGGIEYTGAGGNPRTQSNTAYNNVSPRIGFAYHPLKNLVFQGGFGIFYAINGSEAAATVNQTGYRADSTYFGTAGNSGIFPGNFLSNPYPGGSFVPVTGNTLGLVTGTGGSISAPMRRSLTPYTENYNFAVQYQFPANWMVETRYVGSHGVQLLYAASINQLPDSYLAMGSKLLTPVANPLDGQVQVSGPLSGKTVQQRYLLAPFPQFTGVSIVSRNGAISHYDSVQVKLQKKFSEKLTLLVSYTGGKTLDDGAVNNANVTPASQGSETYQDASIPLFQDMYGLSTTDVSRNFVASFVYTLPFGHGERFGSGWNRYVNAMFGGYQINGIVTAQTGTPLAFSASNVANIFNPGERPNWNGQNAKLSGSVESRLKKYFNTANFSQPAVYTFGNMSGTSGYLRNPGVANLDISSFKTFALPKDCKLELHAEAFNILNKPAFGPPNTSVNSASFGVVSSQINVPRQIQVAAKILF
ncbi:TonB-dependent receptor domain-containing protein [Granulicella arctica]|uniref:TonB-dependent receptor n=1 Tax=Granulicella arctica TaxID=940613 RepID=A0A7Y9TFS4_9BACT|nr:TonB-dependent receptor [Granulicella arctica]NYF77950.1 hypothetical protein [Granulicella arctica]